MPLNFTVFGTPGALVSLRIDGGSSRPRAAETEPGVYEGSYLIDGVDAIRPESRVTASPCRRTAPSPTRPSTSRCLLARGTVPWNVATTPAASRLRPRRGSRHARCRRRAPSARRPQPAVRDAGARAAGRRSPRRSAAERAACSDCAVVESVRAVEAAPSGGVIGTIGGAIAGAILGKELGEAHKRRMLTVLGAIGGAVAGRQIERQATQSTQYEVDLRLADGTLLRRRYEQAPPFAVGATIRLGTPMRGTPAPTF